MPERTIEYDRYERFPNRVRAVEIARQKGIREDAIAWVSRIIPCGEDPTVDVWLSEMRHQARELQFKDMNPEAWARKEAEQAAESARLLDEMIKEDQERTRRVREELKAKFAARRSP